MSQSAEMDLLRQQGELGNSRQIIADQNKYLNNWKKKKKKRQEDKT